MPSSCKDIRAALAECLATSDCVLVHRNKPADCIRMPLVETLPPQCQQLRRGYGECKRGLIDMRKRFRGNKPINLSAELEAGGGAGGDGRYQLYGGAPAVGALSGGAGGTGTGPKRQDGPAEMGEKVEK